MSTQVSRLVHCSMPRPPNRRRRRNRRLSSDDLKSSSSDHSISISANPSSDPNKLSAVLDLSRLQNFLSSAEDAYSDLRTLVSLDDRRRIVVSCRRSTLRFAGEAFLLAFLAAAALRLVSSLLSARRTASSAAPRLVRRDRSLGGREVVVSADTIPLPPRRRALESSERVRRNWNRAGTKLPKWWPATSDIQTLDSDSLAIGKEAYQREADNLIREITDNRMSGKDIVPDDILQLRRICRASGVRVSFDTSNTRDSFYRTSVDFVLNACARAPSQSAAIELAGEDIRQFIAGLANNIGLESVRAARIVSAAVAARTRSRFLQAWALEMQGKHTEAMLELSKICLTFRIFPPEESSAEMEMVARGLEKHLKVEQREFLMDMLAGFCEQEIRTTAAEALGLIASPTGVGDQEQN